MGLVQFEAYEQATDIKLALRPSERAVLTCLTMDPTLTLAQLRELTGLHRDTVGNAVRHLVATGHVKAIRGPRPGQRAS